jgi:hypothetical protein
VCDIDRQTENERSFFAVFVRGKCRVAACVFLPAVPTFTRNIEAPIMRVFGVGAPSCAYVCDFVVRASMCVLCQRVRRCGVCASVCVCVLCVSTLCVSLYVC